jgi:hypothetical protein
LAPKRKWERNLLGEAGKGSESTPLGRTQRIIEAVKKSEREKKQEEKSADPRDEEEKRRLSR